jgi:hypothetical protein
MAYAFAIRMPEVQSPVASSLAVKWLFAAGLITIPFDAVIGVGALGELGYELSFPFFSMAILLTLVLSVTRGSALLSRSLAFKIGLGVLAVVFASLIANLPDIIDASFRERSGFNKFSTSLLVLLYGLALAWLSEQVEPGRAAAFVSRFVCWSALLSMLYVGFELLGRTGALGGLFQVIDGLVHTRQADVVNPWDGSINQRVAYGWDERVRSVSFEPPAFGNYTGFAWPWVWYAAWKATPERKLRAWALLGLFTLVIVFAASRTGLLMLIVNTATIALLAAVYGPRRGKGEAAAAARLLFPVILVLGALTGAVVAASNFGDLVFGVVQGESVSNITRLGFQVAAINIFAAQPLFGVGLGQFGFHVAENMPDWAFRSPEVRPMLTYPLAPWPNVFSIYARISAELGLVGLLGWVLLWTGLALKLAARASRDRILGSPVVSWHYPVILNCIGVLVSGFTTDTFRTPMMWIALGLGCALLRRELQQSSTAPGAAASALG